jgi:hypothetical protein
MHTLPTPTHQCQPCEICRRPLDIDDDDTVFLVTLPPVSLELLQEAFSRAKKREQETPTTGDDAEEIKFFAWAYSLCMPEGVFRALDDTQKVVLGRALREGLGAHYIFMHDQCYEDCRLPPSDDDDEEMRNDLRAHKPKLEPLTPEGLAKANAEAREDMKRRAEEITRRQEELARAKKSTVTPPPLQHH